MGLRFASFEEDQRELERKNREIKFLLVRFLTTTSGVCSMIQVILVKFDVTVAKACYRWECKGKRSGANFELFICRWHINWHIIGIKINLIIYNYDIRYITN